MNQADDAVRNLERPAGSLLTYYVLVALPSLFLFPFVFAPLFFKYHTLRYKLDEEGVSMSWGIFFRREIQLTYKRIQDIHVHRNVIERWLGIATVEIQTASGSSEAEIGLVGIRDHEAVRDFLYRRMRGHEVDSGEGAAETAAVGEEAGVLALLAEIRDELEAARTALEGRAS